MPPESMPPPSSPAHRVYHRHRRGFGALKPCHIQQSVINTYFLLVAAKPKGHGRRRSFVRHPSGLFSSAWASHNCKKKYSLQYFYFMHMPAPSCAFPSIKPASIAVYGFLFENTKKNVNEKSIPSAAKDFLMVRLLLIANWNSCR
jgi:hypothetical protein